MREEPINGNRDPCSVSSRAALRRRIDGLMLQLEERLALLWRQAVHEEELLPAHSGGCRVASWCACRWAQKLWSARGGGTSVCVRAGGAGNSIMLNVRIDDSERVRCACSSTMPGGRKMCPRAPGLDDKVWWEAAMRCRRRVRWRPSGRLWGPRGRTSRRPGS